MNDKEKVVGLYNSDTKTTSNMSSLVLVLSISSIKDLESSRLLFSVKSQAKVLCSQTTMPFVLTSQIIATKISQTFMHIIPVNH